MDNTQLSKLLGRLERLADRVDHWLPQGPVETDWNHPAFRWHQGQMEAIPHPQDIQLDLLLGIEKQKSELERNTRQFIEGLSANNALLWGSRGTGKSSLIKGLLTRYASQGLRVIEVDRHDLINLPRIVKPLFDRPERFIIFSDDLSFEANDPSYKALKAAIEGSIAAPPDNVLIYATSNRRHLLPEYLSENQDAQILDGEIHHGESVEEKISLSERFGLWLAFHPFSQLQYLNIVEQYLLGFGLSGLCEDAEAEALRWALSRGSRSGRVAWQFSRDWAGRQGIAPTP